MEMQKTNKGKHNYVVYRKYDGQPKKQRLLKMLQIQMILEEPALGKKTLITQQESLKRSEGTYSPVCLQKSRMQVLEH